MYYRCIIKFTLTHIWRIRLLIVDNISSNNFDNKFFFVENKVILNIWFYVVGVLH